MADFSRQTQGPNQFWSVLFVAIVVVFPVMRIQSQCSWLRHEILFPMSSRLLEFDWHMDHTLIEKK